MGLIAGLLSIVLGIVEVIIGLRIIFVLFNVAIDTAPAIVTSIYQWSVPLVQPFAGFLQPITLAGFTLDMPAIVALIVYAILGSILIRVLRAGRA